MKPDGITYGFFGSGAFAAQCLALFSAWRRPAWIVTAPARPAGRGKQPRPTPVGALAASDPTLAGVETVESASASKDPAVLSLRERKPVDFSFVVDFGQMIREPLLAWSEHIGCLNVHPSLLPLYRGAAPVQRALMDGAHETGVTIFKLAEGMDCGPVLLQESFATGADDAGTILTRAADAAVRAFVQLAETTPISEWRFEPQDDARATRAPKIAPEEERIDWAKSAAEIADLVRALSPKPGAWTTLAGKRLRILGARAEALSSALAPGEVGHCENGPAVGTGEGLLVPTHLQSEGKKAQTAAEWWNGNRAKAGARCT